MFSLCVLFYIKYLIYSKNITHDKHNSEQVTDAVLSKTHVYFLRKELPKGKN